MNHMKPSRNHKTTTERYRKTIGDHMKPIAARILQYHTLWQCCMVSSSHVVSQLLSSSLPLLSPHHLSLLHPINTFKGCPLYPCQCSLMAPEYFPGILPPPRDLLDQIFWVFSLPDFLDFQDFQNFPHFSDLPSSWERRNEKCEMLNVE